MFKKLEQQCDKLVGQFDQIEMDRKNKLVMLSEYIADKNRLGTISQLVAICTHNSRRSHIAQLWLAVAAHYYNQSIQTYSGGTKATAFFPAAAEALKNYGLEIFRNNSTSNPIYSIRWTEDMLPYQAFSKHFSDEPNPSNNFGAIMVCDSANEACPIVQGADFKLALTFQDPKKYDGSEIAEEKYMECVETIGREILFAFSKI